MNQLTAQWNKKPVQNLFRKIFLLSIIFCECCKKAKLPNINLTRGLFTRESLCAIALMNFSKQSRKISLSFSKEEFPPERLICCIKYIEQSNTRTTIEGQKTIGATIVVTKKRQKAHAEQKRIFAHSRLLRLVYREYCGGQCSTAPKYWICAK